MTFAENFRSIGLIEEAPDEFCGRGRHGTEGGYIGTGTELKFLMRVLMILIGFNSHTCQISAFYIEFKGIKNPPKDQWHCWRLRGRWSLLIGAEVPDDSLDDFDMV